jgi:hypothetical protein
MILFTIKRVFCLLVSSSLKNQRLEWLTFCDCDISAHTFDVYSGLWPSIHFAHVPCVEQYTLCTRNKGAHRGVRAPGAPLQRGEHVCVERRKQLHLRIIPLHCIMCCARCAPAADSHSSRPPPQHPA